MKAAAEATGAKRSAQVLAEALERLQRGAGRGHFAVDLRGLGDFDEGDFDVLEELLTKAAELEIQVALVVDPSGLSSELEARRLHRRVTIDCLEVMTLAPPQGPREGSRDKAIAVPTPPEATETLADNRGLKADAELVAELEQGAFELARATLQSILQREDDLLAAHRARPHEELVPRILSLLDRERCARLLAALPAGRAARALLGNFTPLPDAVVVDLLRRYPNDRVSELLHSMTGGLGWPRRMTEVLLACPDHELAILSRACPPEALSRIVDAARSAARAIELLNRFPLDVIELLADHRAAGGRSPRHGLSLMAALEPTTRHLLAQRNHPATRALLETLQNKNFRGSDQDMTSSRAPVSSTAPPGPSVRGVETRDPRGANFARLDVSNAHQPGHGTRRIRHLFEGVDWISIDERLRSSLGDKRVRTDVLSLDPSKIDVRVFSMTPARVPIDQCESLLPPRNDVPLDDALRDCGLFRLTEAVENEGALGGINGGFHFDYGHYEDVVGLGVDCAKFEGLRFGDPFGWLMSGGVEWVPPFLRRAAFVKTEDGRFHLMRVKMTAIVRGDDVFRWSHENHLPERVDEPVLFTPPFGRVTPLAPDRVDLVVSGREVVAHGPGGGSAIPPIGFVLSVPAGHRALGVCPPGSTLTSETDFPCEEGRPVEALGSGPLLVRSGEIDVDFGLEEFDHEGADSMRPRLHAHYEAARSFAAITPSGRLLFGKVSRIGKPQGMSSAGMTLAELALLTRDVGAWNALALEGGVTSTLVARERDKVRRLSGSRDNRAHESFIANSLLFFAKQRLSDT